MLPSLLIANRGEIACRIIKTCRRLGIRSVAVYSDADRDALHVEQADEAVRVGPAPAAESYLRIDAVVEAAQRTHAAAIHPGYGFLAENPAFARAVAAAGLVFVGPQAEAMERLGDKDQAKAVAAAAGVPVIPGYQGARQDDASFREAALALGFPLLVKAVAGGGGRGMRRVLDAGALEAALQAARREALAAFGRDALLLERLILGPRHVEVQVLGDGRGDAVHLFERDCTLQRRHQKVLEEAPGPCLSPAVREAMGAAAVALARAARYGGAGTVEFLLEQGGRFWFIEMNTRLQVEHPVTEAITGLDLVEWQLRLAAGQDLLPQPEPLGSAGHAIEVRLCAEDPANGFRPSIGRLQRCRFPPPSAGLRIETGVREGDVVTPWYDSMLAKLIVHAPSRDQALERLANALDQTVIEGPATNLDFLRRLVRAPPVRTMAIDTTWLDREVAVLLAGAPAVDDEALLMGTLAVLLDQQAAAEGAAMADAWRSPWTRSGGWRLNAPADQVVAFAAPPVTVEAAGSFDQLTVTLAGQQLNVRAGRDAAGGWYEVADRRRRFIWYRIGDDLVLTADGRITRLRLEGTLAAGDERAAGGGRVMALMPGRVVRLDVEAGALVVAGQPLFVLEAMKMEQVIEAPIAGRLVRLEAALGRQVEEGELLAQIEPVAAPSAAAPADAPGSPSESV